ncbi:MAG: BREX system P-loop protein BrxC [Muribaculaceae bacterium]|nr:BREX system P-loop protein BrxC [Muribaculaceae bacterium]
MKQQDSYAKDITRPIDGVIKAESDSHIIDEIKEYVITAEQMRPQLLPSLFKGLQPGGLNRCVWISGDFGSGKSHLLKILSYVLENNLDVEGEKCADVFADKCGNDFELKKQIQVATSVPTVSILFNIQKKLNAGTKGSVDPVLMIFLKEFNSRLGYDDKKPAIAEIERYFASKGKYEWLKEEYSRRFKTEWVKDRPGILLKLQRLAEVFAEMEGIDQDTAYKNLKTQIDNYNIDSDGFVKLVKNWLDEHPGTRLIFFVDEVGQFIGKDVHRMLSLQTIAEGLGDMTGNRATVMVTSQMDIDSTVGDLTSRQKYDFSRIQGRFTQRISLTSANADEVIQRRILEKTPDAEKVLKEDFEKNRNIIKSLFQFGDDSQYKSNYRSAAEFAVDFPFVDYQLNLLQQSIINLSKNNAFTGDSNSVGERSLLAITHQVANDYKDFGLDRIVQFSDMYEGIRAQLQTKIQNDIMQAEKTLDDELALKVLKALFLLKYVNGFPTTADNVAKILLPTLDTNFPEFKKLVQEALNKLVRQSYIEKGAKDDYHFQTNEEKDIENEIKAQELAPDAINKELMKILRDEVFSENKIKLTANKIFPYGRFVDDQQDGKEADLYIHFVTSNSDIQVSDNQIMTNYSLQHPNQLIVALEEDKHLAEDLSMFLKAEKCLGRLLNNSEGHRLQIVSDKRRINGRRRENLIERLTNSVKGARLYMNTSEITDIRTSDLKGRLNEAMGRLVKLVYTNLDMLTIEYDDTTLKTIITDKTSGDFAFQMDAAMQEVLNFVNRNKSLSVRTKVSDLVAHFRSNTYGWYENATLSILAKLYKIDKISFRYNGNPVDDKNLYALLTNSSNRQNVIVDVEETISNSKITKLKNLYRELFDDETCTAQGAKDVHKAFIERLNKETLELRTLVNSHRFEFIKSLKDVLSEMESLTKLSYPALYSKESAIEDIIDAKEDVADPVKSFVRGRQFSIFESLNNLMQGNQANIKYVEPVLMTTLQEIFTSTEPWDRMTEAKEVYEKIQTEISDRQKEERAKLLDDIETKFNAVKALPSYFTLKPYQIKQIEAIFSAMKEGAEKERFIGNLIANQSEVVKNYDRVLDSINRWVEENNKESESGKEEEKEENNSGSGTGSENKPKPRKVRKVVNRQKAMTVSYSKPILETREDVEAYINTLRKQLMGYIDNETSIMLS